MGHLESWCRRMWTLVILLPLAVGLPQSQLELKLEKSEDFVIGSSCAVEAFSPEGNLDLSKLEGCSNCFEAATTDAEAVKFCTREHLPNVYSRCKEKVESPPSPDMRCSSASLTPSSSWTP